MNLDKYIAGAKLAGKTSPMLHVSAMEPAKEDCVVLLIPKSEWEQLKKKGNG